MNHYQTVATNKLSDTETKYLVYLKGLKGPEPQLWHGDQTKGTGMFQYKPVGAKDSKLLYFRRLEPDEAELDFHELVKKFPFVEGFTKT